VQHNYSKDPFLLREERLSRSCKSKVDSDAEIQDSDSVEVQKSEDKYLVAIFAPPKAVPSSKESLEAIRCWPK